MQAYQITAAEAKARLLAGNRQYTETHSLTCDTAPETLLHFSRNGQHPYAIIVTCSDSRVVPELIFSAGIGDLFVIRVAGNVIDSHQLGSIEYAAEHLGTGLIVVLGHDHCGAVDAAMHHEPDEYKACCLNVQHSCEMIERSLDIQKDEECYGLQVCGAMYHLETGEVTFL